MARGKSKNSRLNDSQAARVAEALRAILTLAQWQQEIALDALAGIEGASSAANGVGEKSKGESPPSPSRRKRSRKAGDK